MNDDQHVPTTQADSIDTYSDEAQRQRFLAFLALALGVLGALGGGVVGTAVQWLSFTAIDNAPQSVQAMLTGGVSVVIGLVAVMLGMQAAGRRDPVDAPIGKVGAALGAVAVLGGVLYAVAIHQQ